MRTADGADPTGATTANQGDVTEELRFRAAFSSISALLGYPVPTLGYLKRDERRPVKED